MSPAEWPELETAFGRALRRGDAMKGEARMCYFSELDDIMEDMHVEARASLVRSQSRDFRDVPEPGNAREELPESDLDGNDKKKEVRK